MNNIIQCFLARAHNTASLKGKWFKTTAVADSQTTNKLDM